MTAVTTNGTDVLSELLIAQLLEEDLRSLSYQDEAERLQLEEMMRDSQPPASKASARNDPPMEDAQCALEMQMMDARASVDALFAQSLQLSDASAMAGRQYAQKVAAMEKNIALDAEFAKRLQEADNSGNTDVDAMNMKDAESVLGSEVFENILAADRNDKGKGKAKASTSEPQFGSGSSKVTFGEMSYEPAYPSCQICFEACLPTFSPLKASLSANSSNKIPFGLRMPCKGTHVYCVACFGAYIQSKLDPNGDGTGNRETVVFPIRCPGCPASEWPGGIPDELAERVLSEKSMVLWHHQKLLDTIPRHYCPNPRCSALVQVHDDSDEPQATCPSCDSIMCVPCRVMWHDGLDCETYQALPPDERSPEDRLVIELAKAKNWRRCPKCAAIVELSVGCNHITCRCGTHFCFKCGSLWVNNRCSRVPSCDLWDEQMLLEERERERDRGLERGNIRQDDNEARLEHLGHRVRAVQDALAAQGIRAVQDALAAQRIRAVQDTFPVGGNAIIQQPPPPPAYYPRIRDDSLDWMTDPNVVCGRHWFTTNMLRDLTCGYCNVQLNSVEDMQYHLSNVLRHPVYACCGRFFRRDIDFERHVNSSPQKFGYHAYQVQRN